MYESRAIDNYEFKEIIDTLREGYLDHRPNVQVATILILEANLGCRIGDIVNLRTDSFVYDGGVWKLNISEQKTKKARRFVVPANVKAFIDRWIDERNIQKGEKLFTIKAPAVWKALRQVTAFLDYENVSCHSFRKKIASDIYNQTHDIEVVREFLQHSSVTITQRYIKRSSHQLEEAIQGSVNII